MDYNDLSPELKRKAEACKTTDELVALAREEGVQLTDEQLEAVAGGGIWCHDGCDKHTSFTCRY